MASRAIVVAGHQDMSTVASLLAGTANSNSVYVEFDDSQSKTERAASLARVTEKLAEDGWI